MDKPKTGGGIVGSLLDKASDFMDMFDGGAREDEEKTPVEVPRKPTLRVSTLTGEWEMSSDDSKTWTRCCNQPLPSGRLCQRVEGHLLTKCFNEDDSLGPLEEEIASEERSSKEKANEVYGKFAEPPAGEVLFRSIAAVPHSMGGYQIFGLDFHGRVWVYDEKCWNPCSMSKRSEP